MYIPSDPLKNTVLKFAEDDNMKQAVTSWLQTLYFLCTETQALVPCWYKSLNVDGDYAEVWCAPRATYHSVGPHTAELPYFRQ
jgi:hypothetical protein